METGQTGNFSAGNNRFKVRFIVITLLLCCSLTLNLFGEGTKELLVNSNLTFDTTKCIFTAGVVTTPVNMIQVWDQGPSPGGLGRATGTYTSIAAANEKMRIKIRVCKVGEVINIGFNPSANTLTYWRLYRPDGTCIRFDGTAGKTNLSALGGGTETVNGATFTYRVPRNSESTQPGYMRYYSQAAVGPAPTTIVAGAGVLGVGYPARTYTGYTPIQYTVTAADMALAGPGGFVDFFIAMNGNDPNNEQKTVNRHLAMFDVTVWDAMVVSPTQPVVRKARLFCSAWDIQCNGLSDPRNTFNSKLYFYSTDSVVTAVTFNRMRPYGFIISANETGCSNTSNTDYDRRSRIQFNGAPDYPIFLNNPYPATAADQTCGIVPKSSFGNVLSANVTGCDNDRCINITVDKTGMVGVSLFPTGSSSFVPRVFNNQTVAANTATCIPWDGLDGAGNPIVNATLQINYFNGLTNLPLYDVEHHQYGYRIELVAPNPTVIAPPGATIKPILVYWDDRSPAGFTVTDFTQGTALDGYWDHDNNALTPPKRVGFTSDEEVIFPPTLSDTTNQSHSTYNLTGCDPTLDHNNAGGNQDIGCHLWTNRGANSNCATVSPNCAETHNTWWNANVIEIPISYTTSNVKVYADQDAAPAPVGTGNAASKVKNVCSTLSPIPINGVIKRDANVLSIADANDISDDVDFTGTWQLIPGSASGSLQLAANNLVNGYIPVAADVTRGFVLLRIVSDVDATLVPCGQGNDTLRINLFQGPELWVRPDQTVCANNALVQLDPGLIGDSSGVSSIVTSFRWTPLVSGVPLVGGTFVPNDQSLGTLATYTPPASFTSGTIEMRLAPLTTTIPGTVTCPLPTVSFNITVNTVPLVNALDTLKICSTSANVLVPVNQATINTAPLIPAGHTVTWIGNGSFTGSTNTLTPTYVPTAAEKALGVAKIIFRVTKTSAPSCGPVQDTLIIAFPTPPAADAGSPASYCRNNAATIPLRGTVSNAGTISWSVSGGTGTFSPASNDTTTFTPTGALPSGSGTYTFTVTANPVAGSPCPAATDDVIVSFTDAPVIGNVTTYNYCVGNPVVAITLSSNPTITPGITGQWFGDKDGTIPPFGTITPNDRTLDIIYTLSTAEVNAGFGVLFFFTDPANGCLSVSDTVLMFPNPNPNITIPDASICANATGYDLPDDAVYNPTSSPISSVLWSTLGTGTFSSASDPAGPFYTPSASDISNGSVKIILSATPLAAGCDPVRDTMTLSFTASPTANAGSNATACANSPAVNIAGTVTPASAGNIWEYVSGPNGSFGNANDLSTTFTATGTPAVGSITTLRLRATLPGCNPALSTMTVTYTAPPTVTISADVSTVCANNPVITLYGSSTTGAGTFTSSSGCVTCFGDVGRVGLSPLIDSTTYTPSATDITNGSVNFTLTSGNNGTCAAVPVSLPVAITITPAPTSSISPVAAVCENNATMTISAASSTGAGTWTSNSGCVSCFSSPSSLSGTYTPSAADIATGSVTFTFTTGSNANCIATQSTATATINKAPSIVAGPDLTVCSDQNTVSLTAATSSNTTSVSWAVKAGAGTGSITNPTSLTNAIYNITAADKANGTAIVVLTGNGASPCAAVTQERIIQFTDLPTVTVGPDRTVCMNDAPAILEATGSNGGSWTCAGCAASITNASSLTASYTPADPADINQTITFTHSIPASGGCPAVSASVDILFNPAPLVTITAPATHCGNSMTLSLTGTFTNSTGLIWTTPDGTGSFSNQTGTATDYTISAADTVGINSTVTFILISTGSSPCSPDSATATVTITEPLILNVGTPQNLCGAPGTVIDLIPIELSGGVTSVTWSIVGASTGTLTPVTATDATYTVGAGDAGTTITFQGQTNATAACPVQTDQVTHTFLAPITSAVTASPASFCQTGSVSLTGAITNTNTGTWSCTNCAGAGTFSPDNSYNNLIPQTSVTFTPSPSDTSAASLSFRLISDGAHACGADTSATVTVTLDKKPRVAPMSDMVRCANNNVITLPTPGITNTTTGFWHAAATKTTGFTPTNNFPGAVSYDPDTTEIQNGFVTLTFIATPAGANTCPPDSAKFVVTFSDAPVANAGLDRTICKNNPTLNLVGTINPGTGFDASWTSPNCGSACFSSPNALSTNYTLSYPADTNGVSSLMLFLTATDPTGLCSPDRDTVVINLTQPPVVDISTTFPGPICNDNPFVNLTGTSTGGYNWSSTGTGTFQINAFQPNVVYPFTAADRAKATLAFPNNIIRIYLSSNSGMCLPVTDSVDIELTPSPVITIAEGDSTTICANINTLDLQASISQTGFDIDWTTTGNGTFSPDAPLSADTTTYTFTGLDKSAGSIVLTAHTTNPVGSTCLSASKQFKVNITPLPIVNAGNNVTVCQTVTSIDLSDASVSNASSATWSTTGSGVFGVSNTTVGAGSVYYPTYLLAAGTNDVDQPSITLTLNAVGCAPGSATKTIFFTPKPTVSAGTDQTVCNEAPSVSISGTATNFSSVNWRVQGSASTFANTAAATYNLTAANKAAGFVNLVFTVNGNGTCSPVTDTVRINIRPIPTLEIGPNASFCSKTLSEALAYNFPAVTVTNSGITPVVKWTTATMLNFDTTNALAPTYMISTADILAGSVSISALVQSHASCDPVRDAMTINITQAPTLDLGPNIGICAASGTTIQLNSTSTNSFGTPSWISDSSGVFNDPNIVAPVYDPSVTEEAAGNTTTIYATISGQGSCPPATDSVKISFNAIPALADLQDSVICFTSGVPFNYNVSSGIIGDWTTDMGAFLAPGGTGQQSVTLQATAVANTTINITFDPTSACYGAQTATAVLTLVQAPTVVADGPSDVCVNNFGTAVNITSTAANQGSLQWSIVQGFGTIGSSTAEDATYTSAADSSDFGLADILVKITANATNPACPAAVDTFTIRTHQAPVPTVTNQLVCSDIVGDADAVTLDGSVSGSGYTGTTWIINSGVASITSINSLNTTATLSALPANVTLQVDGLDGSCSPVDVPLTITAQPAPTFTVASTPFNACSNGASIDLDNANMSPSVPGGMWISTTGGMFTPSVNGATGIEYTPSASDITAGTVDLIYAITDTGVCYKDYRDTVTVTLNTPITIASTSPIATLCAQSSSVPISAVPSIALPIGSTTIWSTPNGQGNFIPTNTALSTNYDPNPLNLPNGGDVANGGAILMIKLDLPVAYGCPDDSDYISLQLVPEPAAIVNAGSTQQICVDRVSAQLQGLILNADGGVWRTTKYGNISDPTVAATGTFSDSTDLEADYFLSATDRTKATIRLYLYSVGGSALCYEEIDSVDISFTPIPVPSATASAASVCADVDSINLTGAFTAMGINGIWSSSGDGYFTNIGTFDPTPIYIPGPTDIAAGSVVFTYSSNSFQDCQVYSARDTTEITPKIEVNVGPDQTVCGNNTTGITITASSPPTNTGVWSILGTFDVDYAGTFTQINPLQATYSPADSIDPVVGAVTLRFVSSGGSPCKPDSAQMVLRIAPAPTVTIATNTQTVCNDVSSINVNVTSIAVASQGFWTSTGTGTFGDPTALNTTYNFSASDLDSTNITIAFITTDNVSNGSQCNAAADAMVITLKPKPVVTVLPQYNCVTPVGVSLDNSSVTYVDPGSSGIWSTSQPTTEGQFSLDKFISSPGATTTSYFPSAADITRGTVTLTLTSAGAGTCQPVSRSVTLNVSNTPIADAGPDLFVCSSSSVSLTATPKTNLVAYDWADVPARVTTYSGLQVTAPMAATAIQFELTVTDDRGCSNKDTVLVNAVSDPLIGQNLQECYDFFGYVNVNIGGVTSPLGGYQWFYNGSLMSGENKDSVRVTQPGYYQVFYTLGACTVPSQDSTLILDLPRVLTPDVIGCKNDTVTATLQEIPNAQLSDPSINEMPFESYVWTADPDQPSAVVPNGNPGMLPTSIQNLTVVDTLTYGVTVSYTTGLGVTCSYDDSVRVISIPIPDPNIVDSTQVCEGTPVTLDANTPPSNLPQLSQFTQLIEWYASGSPATILATGATYSPTASNDYVVNVTIGQCSGDDSARVDFRPFPSKNLGADIKQCFEQVGSVTLDAGTSASVPGLTGVTYQWTSDAGDPALTTSTSQTTVITYAQIKDLEDEKIQAMVTTTNQFGPLLSCPSTDTILVSDVCVPRVFPPTVFHPGDGNPIDAEFTIKTKYLNPDKFKLTVYSRWGEVIFYTEDVNKHWDGTYRGDLMPIGVYAYIITYEGKDELNKGPFRKEGRIVLVR